MFLQFVWFVSKLCHLINPDIVWRNILTLVYCSSPVVNVLSTKPRSKFREKISLQRFEEKKFSSSASCSDILIEPDWGLAALSTHQDLPKLARIMVSQYLFTGLARTHTRTHAQCTVTQENPRLGSHKVTRVVAQEPNIFFIYSHKNPWKSVFVF